MTNCSTCPIVAELNTKLAKMCEAMTMLVEEAGEKPFPRYFTPNDCAIVWVMQSERDGLLYGGWGKPDKSGYSATALSKQVGVREITRDEAERIQPEAVK